MNVELRGKKVLVVGLGRSGIAALQQEIMTGRQVAGCPGQVPGARLSALRVDRVGVTRCLAEEQR